MKRRILSALLALALCAAAAPAALAAPSLESFADLNPNAWYAPYVRYCLRNGLMSGYGGREKSFGPNEPMTRAQLVTILWRMEGEPVTGLVMQYTDVPETKWCAEAVRWAMAAEIMSGYTVLTFAPDDPVTREQFAAILWRYAQHRGALAAPPAGAGYEMYADHADVSGYAEDAMRWACAMGIFSGQRGKDGALRLLPQGESSRAVAATILMRFCLDMGIYE